MSFENDIGMYARPGTRERWFFAGVLFFFAAWMFWAWSQRVECEHRGGVLVPGYGLTAPACIDAKVRR